MSDAEHLIENAICMIEEDKTYERGITYWMPLPEPPKGKRAETD